MKADRITFITLAALAAFATAGLIRAQEVDTKVDATGLLADKAPVTTFSFRAEGVPIRQALALFARANKLNIVPDNDIEGDVTVDFEGLPLDLAMRALIEASGYYFVQSGGLIRVRNRETRLFQIDYINTTRAGQGSSAVQISSSSSSGGGSSGGGGGGGGGSSGEQGSSMTVTATATNDFWGDLTAQLQSMVDEGGRVTINRLAGTILVTDSHRNIENVADFLASVTDRVVRQVDLEVQIYEVGFSNARQVGVDWQRIGADLATRFQTGLIVRNSAFGPDPLPAGITLEQDFTGEQITAFVEALEQQGDVKVVSKPRLRTLNNQPAVVRVGQDLPVFQRESLASTGDNPVITQNITVQNVTVGTVLSITPQISADGVITLDLTPAVTRLVRMVASDETETATTAPVIDVRQATSLVRVRDGDTVVLGGLVQEGSTTTVRKIPVLGDIPGLGRLFRGESTQKETTELIFFLTPRIVSTEGSPEARGVATPPPPTPEPVPAPTPSPEGKQKQVRQHRK